MFTGMKIMIAGLCLAALAILASIVLIITKLTGLVDCSWLIVSLPAMISIVFEIVFVFIGMLFHMNAMKNLFH